MLVKLKKFLMINDLCSKKIVIELKKCYNMIEGEKSR